MRRAPRVALIINPISGTGGRPDAARRRAELAGSLVAAHGVQAEIFLTERPGHARELASAALTAGTSVVVAWGGDGTVNEVASALAFREATLAIVPSGSGNGLAREIGVPLDPSAALAVALAGSSRIIDCGEFDSRLFFNIAGLGLDARVAHQFAAHGLVRRGLLRYVQITARELLRFEADEHTIVADGQILHSRALIVAVANARQYGNGAVIAPNARLDDGRLDVIVVADRAVWRTLVQVPRLFSGRIARVPGVTMAAAAEIEIGSTRQVLYHVDGEPFVGGVSLHARAHPNALRVCVPSS
jgi:YegS/Rv2252/BmrU family lipid kinase